MYEYNLVDEKWLPCTLNDGRSAMLNLREVFERSAEIRELMGDSPPVTVAVHRLLIAILHRAFNGPTSYDEWGSRWHCRSFKAAAGLDTYLSAWRHRFDLFHHFHPFYQTASLSEQLQDGAVIQLYFQPKANGTLFEHSTLLSPTALSPDEAARWLIAFQAFDVGGIKADGAGGKRALLLNSAIALVRGKNLFETLMLNLHGYDEHDEMPFRFKSKDDLPAWEREHETEAKERLPAGYVDLLTWQSRRVLLQPQQTGSDKVLVKNAVIMKGFHRPAGFSLFEKETMMAFRRSKKEGFVPVTLNENKALWRDSMSLFQTVKDSNYRPMTLTWLKELSSNGLLSHNVHQIDFYGLRNDISNEAKLLLWQQDTFHFPDAFLHNDELLDSLRNALDFAEGLSHSLYTSSKTLATFLLAPVCDLPNHKPPDPKAVSALISSFGIESRYWSTLETAFHRLMARLTDTRDSAMRSWFEIVDKAGREVLGDTCRSLSGSAQEHKAIVAAEGAFYRSRRKLLRENSQYRQYLPTCKAIGGAE